MKTILIIQAVYVVFCLVLAYINYLAIKANRKIYHWLNAVLHLLFWCYSTLIYDAFLALLILPFIGRLFFDTALNLFRGLPLDYVSEWVKTNNPRSSVIDKWEWRIFHDGLTPKIVYLLIIIALNMLIYANT